MLSRYWSPLIFLPAVARSWDSWPAGTTTWGSTTHPINFDPEYNAYINYYSSYAIDGNVLTWWNDDTAGDYPDTLVLSVPTPVNLKGIALQSYHDGYVLDYTVSMQTGTESGFSPCASLSNLQSNFSIATCDEPVTGVYKIAITVTLAQDTYYGDYTRISEVYPIFLDEESSQPSATEGSGGVVTVTSTITQEEPGQASTTEVVTVTTTATSPLPSEATIIATLVIPLLLTSTQSTSTYTLLSFTTTTSTSPHSSPTPTSASFMFSSTSSTNSTSSNSTSLTSTSPATSQATATVSTLSSSGYRHSEQLVLVFSFLGGAMILSFLAL